MDRDLNAVGLFNGGGVVAIGTAVRDVGGTGGFAHGLNHLVGLGLGGVLHLDLQHQVAAAFQIQTQPDPAPDNWPASGQRRGEADDAEDAHQHRGDDHSDFDEKVTLHVV